jgi:hypothetical protein
LASALLLSFVLLVASLTVLFGLRVLSSQAGDLDSW